MERLTKQGATPSVPKGYKQTEVGVIPEEWDFGILGDLCSKITDGTHDTPKPVSEGIPFLTAIHVKENKIHYQDCYFLPEEVHDEIYKRCNPEKNDVLMVNIGAGVGTTALVKVDYEFSLKNVALLKTSMKIDGSYLNNILIKRKSKILKDFIAGGAQPFLSLGQISKIQIPLPPTLTEQKAIATALSEVDELISGLDQLLTKKKAIKQGAMQELLTGKTRLKGFVGSGQFKQTEVGRIPEEWEVSTLGSICSFENGDRGFNYPSKSDFKTAGKPFVNAGHLKMKRISQKGMDYISNSKFEQLNGGKFKKGDILFCLRGSLGKFAVVLHEELEGAIASSLIIIRPIKAKLTLGYLEYYLESNYCKTMIELMAGGAAQPNLGGQELGHFYFPLPPTLAEQKAIATVLSDMDEAIALLESKKAKYQELKQGMMQELLTGKIRLV